ncbi:putative zinc finger protein [Solirubrobacter pauli]|uniref:Putative zinc finger protein n=1 Tax=Solirubrobacter pauli TaxID=166793 RepID=A0A660L8T7_9ACTN|nr:zf-HC2 domain-containing protein [Solirubrobacter pauli]RKQ90340.1 putative zinc finger protein [Solirubrobacter pauli]
MSTSEWHVDPGLLAAYARGAVDDADAFSVEAHVVACASCQTLAGTVLSADRLQATWLDVVDTLDAPTPGLVERVLSTLGVAPHVARLLAATTSLTASWLGAITVALAVAVLGAYQGERGLALFLCVAALAPVAGVAATFTRGIDPTHELGVAAPMSGMRLLLLRTVAVVGATLVLTVAGALALPELSWTAAAWLLPALGLTLTSLALATYLPHTTAFAVVAGVWLAATIASAVRPGDALAAFDGGAQLVFGALIAVGGAVLVRRREALDGWSAR